MYLDVRLSDWKYVIFCTLFSRLGEKLDTRDRGRVSWKWRSEEDVVMMTLYWTRWPRQLGRHFRYCRRPVVSALLLEAVVGRRGTVTAGPCRRPCSVRAGKDVDARPRRSQTGAAKPLSTSDRGNCHTCASMTSSTDIRSRDHDVIGTATHARCMTLPCFR